MKNFKRIISTLLIVMFLLGLFSSQVALAANKVTSGTYGGNLKWSYSKNTLTISGKGNMLDDHNYGEGYPWYPLKNNIKKVVIKDGVTSIADSAFYNYKNLKTIKIPNTMKNIDPRAVLETAWYRAQKNGPVYLGHVLVYYKGNMPKKYALKVKDGTKVISSSALLAKENLVSVSMPDTVTYIGDSAFCYCMNLSSIKMSKNLTYAGYIFLKDTKWLNSQPRGVIYCGKTVYIYNGKVPKNTTLKLKKGIVSISAYAFYYQPGLVGISIPDTVKEINEGAFAYTGLKKINIPKSVKKIGGDNHVPYKVDSKNEVYSSDDRGCLFNKKKTSLYQYPSESKAKTYSIPKTVKTIRDYAFRNCSGLTKITIPDTVNTIGEYAFHGCKSLESAKVGNGVKKISEYAFSYCKKLEKVTIGNSVKSIDDGAFYLCNSLKSVKIPDTVNTIGEYAFYGCKSLESVKIGNGVKTINDYAFNNCKKLTSVKMGNSVKTIGKSAFEGCKSLTSINFPDSVTTIGERAFFGCKSLTRVSLGKNIALIDYKAFFECKSLERITIKNPKCEICDDYDTISKSATIYGYKGSTAKLYANDYNRRFVAL